MAVRAEQLTLREITAEDAEAVARLSGELGYPATAAQMETRIRAQGKTADHATFLAAQADGLVVGWIDIGITYHLQTEPYAEIGGLVVASEARSLGIGRELVARAEAWAEGRGVKRVVVRSQIARERAHQFYLREGYQRTKTSAVFTKEI